MCECGSNNLQLPVFSESSGPAEVHAPSVLHGEINLVSASGPHLLQDLCFRVSSAHSDEMGVCVCPCLRFEVTLRGSSADALTDHPGAAMFGKLCAESVVSPASPKAFDF